VPVVVTATPVPPTATPVPVVATATPLPVVVTATLAPVIVAQPTSTPVPAVPKQGELALTGRSSNTAVRGFGLLIMGLGLCLIAAARRGRFGN